MDRLTAAVEVAVEAADVVVVVDVEDATRMKSANWRNSKWKMKH
jgi:hypothetical protein